MLREAKNANFVREGLVFSATALSMASAAFVDRSINRSSSSSRQLKTVRRCRSWTLAPAAATGGA